LEITGNNECNLIESSNFQELLERKSGLKKLNYYIPTAGLRAERIFVYLQTLVDTRYDFICNSNKLFQEDFLKNFTQIPYQGQENMNLQQNIESNLLNTNRPFHDANLEHKSRQYVDPNLHSHQTVWPKNDTKILSHEKPVDATLHKEKREFDDDRIVDSNIRQKKFAPAFDAKNVQQNKFPQDKHLFDYNIVIKRSSKIDGVINTINKHFEGLSKLKTEVSEDLSKYYTKSGVPSKIPQVPKVAPSTVQKFYLQGDKKMYQHSKPGFEASVPLQSEGF